MSWIQLNQALLNATGHLAYADVIERAVWNHAFACQTWDGDGFRYGVPMAGWKPALYFTGPNCCSSSGPRMLGLLSGLIYGRSTKSIYINQFLESTAQVQFEPAGRVEIVQRTEYPTHGRVLLEIRPERRAHFELEIRIPSWCAAPSLSVNAVGVSDLQPGTYASIERTWNRGDRVELSLPTEANWVRGEHGNMGQRALTRGPLVYVADGVWQDAEVGRKLVKTAGGQELQDLKAPKDALGPFYMCPGKLSGQTKAKLTLSPFGNLGRWYADPDAKPDIHAKLYNYSVWLPDPGRPSGLRN